MDSPSGLGHSIAAYFVPQPDLDFDYLRPSLVVGNRAAPALRPDYSVNSSLLPFPHLQPFTTISIVALNLVSVSLTFGVCGGHSLRFDSTILSSTTGS